MRGFVVAILFGLYLYLFKDFSFEQIYLPAVTVLLYAYLVLAGIDIILRLFVTVGALNFAFQTDSDFRNKAIVLILISWLTLLVGSLFPVLGADFLLKAFDGVTWVVPMLVIGILLILGGSGLRQFKISFTKKVTFKRTVTYRSL